MTSEKIFENINQIKAFLKELGYQVSYGKIRDDIARQALSPRKGGGWTAASVEKYARAHLKRAIDTDIKKDKPAEKSPSDEIAVQRQASDAALKSAQAKREELKLRVEQGTLVSISLFDEELAKRAIVFRNILESFIHKSAEKIAALFGADTESAEEILKIVGGQAEALSALIVHCQNKIPTLVELYEELLEAALNIYATENFMTEEIADKIKNISEVSNAGESVH